MTEDGGNGKIKPEEPVKTEEQLSQERKDRFAKDPESFVELSELICAVMRNSKSQLGISLFLGNAKRSELNNAQAELNNTINHARQNMDMETAMINQSKIVPAKHGMLDGVRGFFGGK